MSQDQTDCFATDNRVEVHQRDKYGTTLVWEIAGDKHGRITVNGTWQHPDGTPMASRLSIEPINQNAVSVWCMEA